jgi:enoyl-CoA hydratase
MADLIYEKRDGIAYLTMNRPEKRNSLSPEMVVRLAEAWGDYREDDSLRVAILTGAGERAFCAGADLGSLIPLLSGARGASDDWDEQMLKDPKLLHVALLRRIELYKPVIAAVNGFALAGGTEILQGTDIRISVPRATYGLTEVKVGVVPGGGSLVKLARQIPWAKAMEILLTGNPIDAEEARRLGLVNEIVPEPELMARAEEVAHGVAANGPLAVQACKEALLRTNGLPLSDAFDIEDEVAQRILASEDAVEGPRAFMEKRAPVWQGR